MSYNYEVQKLSVRLAILYMKMDTWRFFQLLFLACFTCVVMACNDDFISAVGDPGMRRDGLRVAIEAWNQCNEVGEEAVDMGSPRMADCFDVGHSTSSGEKSVVPRHLCAKYDRYAPRRSCTWVRNASEDFPRPWQFWMIMLKSGNMTTSC
uniref:DUF7705 domain-containing protein n=1 Tax=Salix viminalis TaxID=40686 RepID=A0A6N2KQC9_SALVM